MTDMDVAILIVKTASRVITQSDYPTAEQILVETMTTHPNLPWGMVINGLYTADHRYWWARRALLSNERLNDGNVA